MIGDRIDIMCCNEEPHENSLVSTIIYKIFNIFLYKTNADSYDIVNVTFDF